MSLPMRWEFEGRQLTARELAAIVGATTETVRNKLRCGWTAAEVVSGHRDVELPAIAERPAPSAHRARLRAFFATFESETSTPQTARAPRHRRPRSTRKAWPKVAGRIGRNRYQLCGEVVTMEELCALTGMRSGTIRKRLRRGIPIEQAIRVGSRP